MRRLTRLHSLGVVAAALLIAQVQYIQSSDDNTREPRVVGSGIRDAEVCASAADRCKSGLKNIRKRYAANLGRQPSAGNGSW